MGKPLLDLIETALSKGVHREGQSRALPWGSETLDDIPPVSRCRSGARNLGVCPGWRRKGAGCPGRQGMGGFSNRRSVGISFQGPSRLFGRKLATPPDGGDQRVFQTDMTTTVVDSDVFQGQTRRTEVESGLIQRALHGPHPHQRGDSARGPICCKNMSPWKGGDRMKTGFGSSRGDAGPGRLKPWGSSAAAGFD